MPIDDFIAGAKQTALDDKKLVKVVLGCGKQNELPFLETKSVDEISHYF
ncbi:hypothetical protein C4G84_RS11185 [Vibrio parahaemolyticus O5:K30]|nr:MULTISPECIES: hypothetical protein [Vibrio]EJG0764377.1 hypothetical protein [Vibrio parahaemolyticus O5:K30]EJI1384864.1 hypothetical protein [Vibrio alginolyticus]EJL8712852.1 hypothetical protein [Vibrio alginolyticus]USD75709.1 hypothetical protein J4N43_19635 [Vibrio sp. SCSIO 43009]